jgi:hypothetical protein
MADDLAADKTPGFKVGEKKTIDEYQKLGESCLDAFANLHNIHNDDDVDGSACAVATPTSPARRTFRLRPCSCSSVSLHMLIHK